ncbi:MAG: non-canonical purine NTP pyrophosphatase [Thermoanaerobaculia bacterium]
MTRQLVLATSNPNKALEAERILRIPLLHVAASLPEIQAATVEEITRHKLEVARSLGYDCLIVEDVSLGFDELGNFPGPYVRWLLEAAGGKGLGAIAFALRDRSALAQCCLGYWNGRDVITFLGETRGEILVEPRGTKNFGWDPWFLPADEEQTYAELPPERKDRISHRGRAYRRFLEYLRESEPDLFDGQSR